jgi:hypothetical protein
LTLVVGLPETVVAIGLLARPMIGLPTVLTIVTRAVGMIMLGVMLAVVVMESASLVVVVEIVSEYGEE